MHIAPVPFIQSVVRPEINKPGNKGNRHSQKKDHAPFHCPEKIFPHQKGKCDAHHPRKEKPKHGKFDIGSHPR